MIGDYISQLKDDFLSVTLLPFRSCQTWSPGISPGRPKGAESAALGLAGCESRCVTRGAQGCPSEQGACARAGTLLPARISAQAAQGASQSALGRSSGWKGRVLFQLRGSYMGQGCSQLHMILRTFLMAVLK